MTAILGLSAFYHDSAACLVVDGEIIAAVQEERFTRIKHDSGFPVNAVRYCLKEAAITAKQLDYVGGAGIDYRERSPLVIPPSMDLPPPGSAAAAAARDPAWPKDPERKKTPKVVKINRDATPEEPGTSSRLSA